MFPSLSQSHYYAGWIIQCAEGSLTFMNICILCAFLLEHFWNSFTKVSLQPFYQRRIFFKMLDQGVYTSIFEKEKIPNFSKRWGNCPHSRNSQIFGEKVKKTPASKNRMPYRCLLLFKNWTDWILWGSFILKKLLSSKFLIFRNIWFQ